MKKKIIIIVALTLLVIGGGVGTGIYISNNKSKATQTDTGLHEKDDKDVQAQEDSGEKEPFAKKEDAKQTEEQPVTTQTDNVISSEDIQGVSQPVTSGSDGRADSMNSVSTEQPAAQSGGSVNPPIQLPTTEDNAQPVGNEGSRPPVGDTTTTEHTPVWHEPIYQDVWVVDVPAHTEEIPEYETRYRVLCNECGADITNDPLGHTANPDSNCAGYHSDYYNVQIGTTVLEYPEEGHWEKTLIQEGYWE